MKNDFTDSAVKFFISVLGMIAIFGVLKELQHIFIPMVIAYFLYFVFQPVNKFMSKYKIPNSLAIVINILTVVLIVWGISRIIMVSFNEFEAAVPVYEAKFNSLIITTAKSFGISDPVISEFNLFKYLNQTLDIGGIASGFFSTTLSFVSTVFFVLFFFIFISGGHEKIIEAIKNRYALKVMDEANGKKVSASYIDKKVSDIPLKIQNYIVAKFLISLITSLLVGIVFWLFGLDFVVVWVVLTFLFNFIPNIGSVIAVVLPTVVALVQFESAGYALLIMLIITAIQNIIGNILEPKIMGNTLGLNPLVILFSLLLWGYIWGLVGMFLSVPITAVIKILVSDSESPNLRFVSDIMGN